MAVSYAVKLIVDEGHKPIERCPVAKTP